MRERRALASREEVLREIVRSPAGVVLRSIYQEKIEERIQDIAALAGAKDRADLVSAYAAEVKALIDARDLVSEPKPQENGS